MNTDNPYQPANQPHSQTPALSKKISRWQTTPWMLAYCYPVFAPICFYSTWLVAWISIGHLPRPMLDDPKDIGGWMDLFYGISLLCVASVPLLTPIGFIASATYPGDSSYVQRATRVAGYVVMCFADLALLCLDPGHVIEWWLD